MLRPRSFPTYSLCASDSRRAKNRSRCELFFTPPLIGYSEEVRPLRKAVAWFRGCEQRNLHNSLSTLPTSEESRLEV
jgi:hypothetical protein